MVCFGLDGLAKLPLMAPVVLLIVKASLLVFSAADGTVIVLLAFQVIWLVMVKGKLPPSSVTCPLVRRNKGLSAGLYAEPMTDTARLVKPL